MGAEIWRNGEGEMLGFILGGVYSSVEPSTSNLLDCHHPSPRHSHLHLHYNNSLLTGPPASVPKPCSLHGSSSQNDLVKCKYKISRWTPQNAPVASSLLRAPMSFKWPKTPAWSDLPISICIIIDCLSPPPLDQKLPRQEILLVF